MALSSSQAIPELRSGIDLTKADISVEEAFVASRIDGRCGVAELATLIGKNAGDTKKILSRLAQAGVISFGGIESESDKPMPGQPGEDGNYENFIFPANLIMETGDLDEQTRKRVIWTHDNLEKWNHYELLQVSHRVDAAEIKKHYFLRSKEWHPDRFRRGELGSFKRMIEIIYKQINEAYRVLSKAQKRKEYDKTCVFDFSPEELEEMLKAKKEEERAKKHDEQVKQRRLKNNPVRQRMMQAKKFYQEALDLESAGRSMDALRAVQMAVTYDANRNEFQELAARLRDHAGEHRIERFMKRGQRFEATLVWDDAIDMFEEAVRIAPNSGKARLRLSFNLLMGNRDAQVALGHAQRAVALLPEEAEAYYVVGRLYEKIDMDKLAKRAYEQALKFRPTYVDVKKRLKRLKWGI
jgi:tetratricopeptide (TPR) repeat protein